MASYRIADYFPLAARQEAANRKYTTGRVCAEGMCPMAVALHFLGLDGPKMPGGSEVGTRLFKKAVATQPEIATAAAAFIKDWDAGRIKDLRDALAVPNDEKKDAA